MYRVKVIEKNVMGRLLEKKQIIIREKNGWGWKEYREDAVVATGERGGKYYLTKEDAYWIDGRGKEVWGVYREYTPGYFKRVNTISENEIEYIGDDKDD